MRQLTEPQAWREIARRLGNGKRFQFGLCYEAGRVWCEGRCSGDTEEIMQRRARKHVSNGDGLYGGLAYPRGGERDARILAALWMALEAEEGVEP